MSTLVTIGDFSRMSHLSVKALRLYHEAGLLEPAHCTRARSPSSTAPTARSAPSWPNGRSG
jgi:hypothetical protein